MSGAKSSQDVFDEAMFRIFGDIHHCLNQRDDILLGGRDQTEHREVLKTILNRARDHKVTFNREKCQFGVGQIEFFGHGLKPSPDKVRAVKEGGVPENKEAVQSFLCTEASFNEGLAPEDRQRRTTGTLHQPNNDRN